MNFMHKGNHLTGCVFFFFTLRLSKAKERERERERTIDLHKAFPAVNASSQLRDKMLASLYILRDTLMASAFE